MLWLELGKMEGMRGCVAVLKRRMELPASDLCAREGSGNRGGMEGSGGTDQMQCGWTVEVARYWHGGD